MIGFVNIYVKISFYSLWNVSSLQWMNAWNQIHSSWNFLQILDIFFANFSNTYLFNRLIFIVWKHDFIASEMLVSCSERMLGIKFILQKTSFRFNISIVQPFNAVILVFVMSVYKLSWPMSRRSENSGGLLHQL